MDTEHAAEAGLTVRRRLAAFGPRVWSYGPVAILGLRFAVALVTVIMGAALVAVPIVLVVYFGSELAAVHTATEDQFVPDHLPVVNPSPVFPRRVNQLEGRGEFASNKSKLGPRRTPRGVYICGHFFGQYGHQLGPHIAPHTGVAQGLTPPIAVRSIANLRYCWHLKGFRRSQFGY